MSYLMKPSPQRTVKRTQMNNTLSRNNFGFVQKAGFFANTTSKIRKYTTHHTKNGLFTIKQETPIFTQNSNFGATFLKTSKRTKTTYRDTARIVLQEPALRLQNKFDENEYNEDEVRRDLFLGAPNPIVFSYFVDFCRKNKEVFPAEEYFQEMMICVGKVTPHSFDQLINLFSSQGYFEKAIEYLNKMNEFDFIPPASSYDSVLNALSLYSNDIELIEKYYNELLVNHKPSKVTYISMIDAYAKAKNYQKTIIFAEEMVAAGFPLDDFSYLRIICCCAETNHLEEATKLLHELLVLPDTSKDIHIEAINSLISAYCEKQDYNKAKEMEEIARNHNVPFNSDTYHIYMLSYCNNGDCENTEEYCNLLVKNGFSLDVMSFNCLLSVYVNSNNVAKVNEYLEQMRTLNIEFDSLTYHYLLKFYCNNGEKEKIEALIKEVQGLENIADPIFFETLLSYYESIGDTENFEKYSVSFKLWKIKTQERKSFRDAYFTHPMKMKQMLHSRMSNDNDDTLHSPKSRTPKSQQTVIPEKSVSIEKSDDVPPSKEQ